MSFAAERRPGEDARRAADAAPAPVRLISGDPTPKQATPCKKKIPAAGRSSPLEIAPLLKHRILVAAAHFGTLRNTSLLLIQAQGIQNERLCLPSKRTVARNYDGVMVGVDDDGGTSDPAWDLGVRVR
jgi:hypothetical protein